MSEPFDVGMFLFIEGKNLWAFKLYWERMNTENPLDYPAEMTEGEWHEQYLSFVEANFNRGGAR